MLCIRDIWLGRKWALVMACVVDIDYGALYLMSAGLGMNVLRLLPPCFPYMSST